MLVSKGLGELRSCRSWIALFPSTVKSCFTHN